MLLKYPYSVTDRLMRYVQIDTQSDPHSKLHPSTPKQKELSNLLAAELIEIGAVDVVTDEFGYVYGTIPATSSKKIPVIFFFSHIDKLRLCRADT